MPWMRLALRDENVSSGLRRALGDPQATLYHALTAGVDRQCGHLLEHLVKVWAKTALEADASSAQSSSTRAVTSPVPPSADDGEARPQSVNLLWWLLRAASQLDTVYGTQLRTRTPRTFPASLIMFGAQVDLLQNRGMDAADDRRQEASVGPK